MDKKIEVLPEVGENQFWRVTKGHADYQVVVSLWYRNPRWPHRSRELETGIGCFTSDIAQTAQDIWDARGRHFASIERRDAKLGDYPPKVL